MSRCPSGTEIVSHCPVREWFTVPDVVKTNFPEIKYWELNNAYNHALRVLNRMAKWDECKKKKEGTKTLFCI